MSIEIKSSRMEREVRGEVGRESQKPKVKKLIVKSRDVKLLRLG